MSIRLVLADDHPLILDALHALFSLEEDMEVVARCTSGADTVEAVQGLEPDVLILDLRMPDLDGLGVLRALRQSRCPTRVVVLTGSIDRRSHVQVLRLGVRGLVLKEMAPRLLVQCVRKVVAGHVWLENRSVTQAIDLMLSREAGERDVAKLLTPREIEVVRLVAEGLRNKDIARRLSLSEGTVKVHLHNIYEKLGVGGRLELLTYAHERELA